MGKLKILLGIIISATFLYFTLRGIYWKEVGKSLSMVNYWLLFPAILLHFFAFFIRSIKWSIITSKFKRVSTSQLFPLVAIGLTMNNILPLRAGEIGRIIILSNKFKLGKIKAGMTLLIERLFDIIGLLIVIAIFIRFNSWPQNVKGIIVSSSILLIAFIIVTPITLKSTEKLLSHKSIKKLEKIHILKFIISKLDEINKSYFIFNDKRTIFNLTFLSVILWILEGISYYIIAMAFHFNISIPVFIFFCAIINLSSAIPSTAGFIGTFEFFATSILIFLNISKSIALSYVLILHLELLIPITIVGLYLYFFRGYHKYLSLKEIENG